MAKYKLCPNCGERNSPISISCIKCDMDLTTVPVMDSATESAKRNEEQSTSIPEQVDLVKICDCGAINPVQARRCLECGEELADVAPVPRPAEKAAAMSHEKHFQLCSLEDDSFFTIPCAGVTIGREFGMRELLFSKKYVSRIHAKLTVVDGDLYIENLSTTNFTYVNNVRIPQGKIKLNVGDEIGLGGISIHGSRQEGAAYFVVGTI